MGNKQWNFNHCLIFCINAFRTDSNVKSDAQPSTPAHPKQHEKAASAIGLALLDVSKPKSQEETKTGNNMY